MFIRHMILYYKDLLFCMNNVVLSDCVCIIDEKDILPTRHTLAI
jgi:hypothetical protein